MKRAFLACGLAVAIVSSVTLIPAASFAKTWKACEQEWKANKESIQQSGKKRTDFITECRAETASAEPANAPAQAEQPKAGKTVKACAAEWTANKASIHASGKTRKDFITECRAGTSSTAAVAPAEPAQTEQPKAAAETHGKTVKACAAEWTANKASLQASGKTRKDFITECRAGTSSTASAAPAEPAQPEQPKAAAETKGKTVKACAAEWTANKASIHASGKTRKDFITECRAGNSSTASAAPAEPAQPEQPKAAVEAKTVKACTAEWTANKASLQASGKTRKDFITECRAGTSSTASAAPAQPAQTEQQPAGTAAAPQPVQPEQKSAAATAPRQAPAEQPRPQMSTEPAAPLPASQFISEAAAKAHCPGDTIVWANTRSKVYHYATSRRYGHTKVGAYMCEKETASAGIRAPKRERRL